MDSLRYFLPNMRHLDCCKGSQVCRGAKQSALLSTLSIFPL
jgi:hypothetical protein